MAGIVDDFKKFLLQGNVVDLAVAVIIGGAFGKIVDSLVKDLVTPGILSPVLAATGMKSIKDLVWNGITYGNFLAEIINFIVVAASIFIMIRMMENMKKRTSRKQSIAETAAPTTEEQLVTTLNRLADSLDRR
jgi:large conductance mechanosensitive channel